MNNKHYHFLIDFINILLRFLASYIIIGTAILFTSKDTASVIKTFILLPAPFISYLLGRHLKHIGSFLALHITMMAVYTFTSHNGFVITFYMVYLVILTIIALNNRLQEEKPCKTNTSLILSAVFPAIYLLNHYLGITELDGLIFTLVTLFVLFYFLNMYLINFEGFFQKHSSMSNVPMKQIKNTNHILILFFGIICVVVMLFFSTLPVKELLSVIGSLLIGLLRAFFSLFPGNGEEAAPLDNVQPETSVPPLGLTDAKEPSLLFQYIQDILLGLVTIAMIAGAIALILYGLYRIYQRFYEKKYNNFRDVTEFISPFDKREKINRNDPGAVGNQFFGNFPRSNNGKIRKYFYKSVLSQKKNDTLLKNLTPTQLSEYALNGQNGLSADMIDPENVKQLALYYEKARYSKEECTKEEVMQVKTIIKTKGQQKT
ncbi:MAG: hypothetical protein WCD89_19815 [Anaerocolumna sp.]